MNGDEANAQQTTFELRFSSREQSPEVEASFAKIQQTWQEASTPGCCSRELKCLLTVILLKMVVLGSDYPGWKFQPSRLKRLSCKRKLVFINIQS